LDAGDNVIPIVVTAQNGVATSTYTLTVNRASPNFTLVYIASTGGVISGTTPQLVVSGANGTEVVASPNVGYHFVSWNNGLTSASRTDMNILADVTYTATFAINTYTLTYAAGSNGSVTGSLTQSIDYGGNTTAVTASPVGGYIFVNWSDGLTQNPRVDTNVSSNKSVTANFVLRTTGSRVYTPTVTEMISTITELEDVVVLPPPPVQETLTPQQQKELLITQIKQQLMSLMTQLIQLLNERITQINR
jgi:hypothetical protein